MQTNTFPLQYPMIPIPQGLPAQTNQISPRQKIHVSNLPLNVTQHQLQQAFQHYGQIIDIRIIKKTPTGLPLNVSLYAFIAFANPDSAEQAIRDGGFGDWIVKPQIDKTQQQQQMIQMAPSQKIKKDRSRSRSNERNKPQKPQQQQQKQRDITISEVSGQFQQGNTMKSKFQYYNADTQPQQLNSKENDLVNEFLQTNDLKQTPQKDYNIFWSGFMLRSKSHKVMVDAKCFDIEPPFQISPQIQVNYKGNFNDALRVANDSYKFILCPSDSSQNPAFQEYIHYFLEKNKTGVAQIDSGILYLLPPHELTNQIHHLNSLELLVIYQEDKKRPTYNPSI